MRIVVVGAGLVGTTLAERLSGDGHDVSIVDSEPARLRSLSDHLDVEVIHGTGASADVLRRARIDRADAVMATTDSDEANLIVALLASSLFGISRIVVRLHAGEHMETFELIGREHPGDHIIVNPEQAAVERIATLLQVPGAVDVLTFMEGGLLVAGFRMHSSEFVGMRVSDMKTLFAEAPTLAVAIHRNDAWIVPKAEDVIAEGDLVYYAIARDHLRDLLDVIGAAGETRGNVLIAGAGRIGLDLARRLETDGVRVSLVESDAGRARAASESLTKAHVIHGSPMERSLLEEEEIAGVASFVAVSDDHESNLVAGLLAKRLGAGRAIVLVDNPALVDLVGETGIDAIISPRVLAIGLALESIRGGRVRSVAQLLEDRIEIVEAEASRGSRLVVGAVSSLELPPESILAAIRRGERLLVPRGEDRVEPGDRLLFIASTEAAAKLADFLSE
jgi:trk system potassium uptake protein TrkA